jgi:hypothetical protein
MRSVRYSRLRRWSTSNKVWDRTDQVFLPQLTNPKFQAQRARPPKKAIMSGRYSGEERNGRDVSSRAGAVPN